MTAVASVPTPVAGHPILRAFRHRNYRLFFAGQLTSLLGTFLTQAATSWFVYRLTHSYALMGLVGFFGQLPVFLIAPFAGVWADRVNRRNFLVLTQALSSAQSFALAWLAHAHGNNPAVAVPGLVWLAVAQGVVNAFDMPARQAFVVEMVGDRADLANAIALNSTMVHLARVVGPAVAGLVIARVGESACFLADGASYFAVIASLVAMVVIPRPPRPPRPRGSVRAELSEGVRYVVGFGPVRTLMLLMAAMSLAGLPVIALLMPAFGDHFGGGIGHGAARGAQTFGLLGAASGAGSLAGAIYLAGRKSVLGLGRLIGVAAAVSGVSLMAFGQSRHLWLSVCILPLGGWGMMTCFAASNTIVQTLVPDAVRGRVMAFFGMAVLGVAPFGALIAGHLAAALSPPGDPLTGASRTLLICGVVLLVAAAAYLWRLPAMRAQARPVYVQRGILPAMAESLGRADDVPGLGDR